MPVNTLIWSILYTGILVNPQNSFPSEEAASGILQSVSAIPNPSGELGLAVVDNFFFDQKFINNEKHARNRLRLVGNYSFGWNLEAFLGTSFVFNEHSTADRSSSTTSFLEKTDVGLRWGKALIEGFFYVGAYSYASFFSGSQSLRQVSGFTQERSGPFVSAKASLLGTLDFKDKLKNLPLRAHLNIGYRSPNGDRLPADPSAMSARNDQVDIFNLNSFKYNALVAAIGLEAPYRWVNPFVEYSAEYAIFTGNQSVRFSDNRHIIGGGALWTIHPSFGVLTAMEVGLMGDTAGHRVGIPQNIPWQVYLGVKFHTSAKDLFKSTGNIRGRVVDADSGFPLPEVTVTMAGEVGLPQVTDLAGFYEFRNVDSGKYQIRFDKQGYQAQTHNIELAIGEMEILDVSLNSLGPKKGAINARIIDAVTGNPISKAYVKISALDRAYASNELGEVLAEGVPEGIHNMRVEAAGYIPADFPIEIFPKETLTQSFSLKPEPAKMGACMGRVTNNEGTGLTAVFTTEDGSIPPFGTDPLTGNFNQALEAGTYQFKVQAENYLPQTIICEVSADSTSEVNIILEKPEKATVVEDKIVLPEAIFFAFDSAEIDPKSFETLDQVAEILKSNTSYDYISIEGHTDNIGTEAYNLDLSQRRAQSVQQYLIDKGVDANRLKASGFGESQPVATNVTPEGRAENRRVEFNIIRNQP